MEAREGRRMNQRYKINAGDKEGENMEDQLDEDVKDVEFGDPEIMRCVTGEPTEDDRREYYYCPLCDADVEYYGNIWGTTPCCDFEDPTWVERMVAARLMAGDSKESVCAALSRLHPRFCVSYATRIADLLDSKVRREITCLAYKKYLRGLVPCTQDAKRVTGYMVHKDGGLTLAERGRNGMMFRSYHPADVEIMRNALADLPAPAKPAKPTIAI
jgi:hypothetical protein